LLGGAVLAVLAMTLVEGHSGVRSVSLMPGSGTASSLSNVNHGLGMLNLFGNIAMLVPIGFLCVAALRRTLLATTLLGSGLSSLIEVSQYTLGRAADVDDVLLNSAGTLSGGLIALATVAAAQVIMRTRAGRAMTTRAA
jgi:glycopeptide antibiotics resistance protein